MSPPFFPVRASQLSSEIEFRTVTPGTFAAGGARITVAAVPHTGETFGYRIERDGVTVVYISDHQQPVDDPMAIDPAVLALCEGADLLIHDAQYTPEEFLLRSNWGHCTVDYAVHVAATARVASLVLFHHDPSHDDESVDLLSLAAAESGRARGVRTVVAASEGLTLSLRPSRVRA
jgi:ribonuclease BN (tRNA processing enzyme)